MRRVIGARFKSVGKVYYFLCEEFEVSVGEYLILETSRGIEYGKCVVGPKFVDENNLPNSLKKCIRIATQEDKEMHNENKIKEKEAFKIAQEKIREFDLGMNLVEVEYTFDNNKIIFYFIAEGRVDFRELVKTLASIFKTRIELRQIGVRDEAKSVGGIGTCGRSLCCSTFLGDFTSVSIKMAKEQNLSLNPSKISGMCGRLMCCLKYEQDTYEDIKQRMPNIGSIVDTKFGEGEVIGSSILKERVRVKFNDEQEENIRDIKLDEIQVKYNNLKNSDEDKNNKDLFEENYDCEEFSKYFINDILEKNKDDY